MTDHPANIPDHEDDENSSFQAALNARYEGLSLLTLDIAIEAGESVQEFSRVDLGPKRGRFDHGVASMTKAIWAHTVIERLRGGDVPRLHFPLDGGDVTAKIGSTSKPGDTANGPGMSFAPSEHMPSRNISCPSIAGSIDEAHSPISSDPVSEKQDGPDVDCDLQPDDFESEPATPSHQIDQIEQRAPSIKNSALRKWLAEEGHLKGAVKNEPP